MRVAWNDLAEGFILLDSHTAQFKPQVEPWPDAGKFESHDRLEGLFFQALARLMITRETESEHEAALATALWMLMHGHCGKTRIGWRCMPAFDWGSAAPHWSNTGAVRRLCREGWARRQCSGPPSSAASSCREARRSNAGVSLRRSDTSNRARCAPWAQSARRDRTRQAGGQGEGTGALPQVLARRAGEGGQTSAHQPCGRGGQNPSGREVRPSPTLGGRPHAVRSLLRVRARPALPTSGRSTAKVCACADASRGWDPDWGPLAPLRRGLASQMSDQRARISCPATAECQVGYSGSPVPHVVRAAQVAAPEGPAWLASFM